MKAPTFTQSMSWLHTWSGLLFGWLLVPIFFTGTLAVFEPEISHWMRPEIRHAPAEPARVLAVAEARLRQVGEGAPIWRVQMPSSRQPAVGIVWGNREQTREEVLHPLSGEVLPVRATEGGHFFTHFHAELDAGKVGRAIVCLVGLVMLAALINGIVVHKKIFQDFFTFRPQSSAQRSWLDAHNVLGVLGLPFLLLITYTGVVILVDSYLPAATYHFYDGKAGGPRGDVVRSFERRPAGVAAPLPSLAPLLQEAETVLGAGHVGWIGIRAPGDREATVQFMRHLDDRLGAVADHITFAAVSGRELGRQTEWNPVAYAFRTQVGLHLVHFGGYPAQWLYFLSGLAGTAMMAVGLVLFTIKRRKRPGHEFGAATARVYAAIESLNVAAVAGVMLASAAFLWANRLLPADLAERAAWEIGAFFAVWALTLVHAGLRPPGAAWRGQLYAAGLAWALLPLCNVAGAPGLLDAMRLGVDLTALVGGLALVYLGWRVSRRFAAAAAKEAA